MTQRRLKKEDPSQMASAGATPARRSHATHSTRGRKTETEATPPPVSETLEPATPAAPKKTPRKSKPAAAITTAAVPAAAPTPAPKPEFRIDHEAIARLAYSFWEARGRSGGSAEEDWHRAEQELHRQREWYFGQEAS